MKKRNLWLSAALIGATAATAVAQTEVTAGITRGKDYGVTYILPKTEIELTVQATRHTYTPGEFVRYAERYLRMTNVPQEASVSWTLDRVETTLLGVPDKENVYFVKMKDKTVAPLIELTRDGIICSINMPLGSSAKASGANAGTSNTGTASPGNTAAQGAPTAAQPAPVDPRSFLTEEILLASSTAKMAELVAKEIYAIRDTRNALTRGEADNLPKDGAQLKLMLDNLSVQEKALTQMFIGTTTAEVQRTMFRIVPKEMKQHVPFRFSAKLGILSSDNLAGEPVYLTLTDLHSVIIPPAPPADGKKTALLDGIAYNVPGRAKLTLQYAGKPLYDGEIPVTQFGVTEYLAPVLFNKNSLIQVLFNPNTGGLIKVERGEGN
jgi:hypothetical protein